MTRAEFGLLQLVRPEHVPFWDKLSFRLVAFIDRLAVRLGEVPKFISTFRTPQKNEQVGGKPTSFHLTGEAADLLFSKTPLGVVYDMARQMDSEGDQIGGIGLYLTPKPDGHTIGTVHLDVGPRYASGTRPRLWGRPEDGQYTSVNVVLAKLGSGGTVVGLITLLLLFGLMFSQRR